PDDRYPDAFRFIFALRFRCRLDGWRAERERPLDEIGHVLAVRRGDRHRHAETQFVEFRGDTLRRQALGFVDSDQERPPGSAQELGDRAVLAGKALAAVDHEYDDVGLRDRGASLLRHGVGDTALRLRLEAARVDDEVRAIAATAAPVLAIASEARKIRHQRLARRS